MEIIISVKITDSKKILSAAHHPGFSLNVNNKYNSPWRDVSQTA